LRGIYRSFIAAFILSSILFSACTGSQQVNSTQSAVQTGAAQTSQAGTVPTEIPATTDPFPGDGPWPITFTTEDNIALDGSVFGKSGHGVILAPMYPGGPEDWLSFAQSAAAQGYRVLTFNLRGYGKSTGDRNTAAAITDVEAAVAYLKSLGADHITLIGAGLGGTASIKVAAKDNSIAGLGVISSPRAAGDLTVEDSELAALTQPSLWLAARNDMTHNIEDLYNAAAGNKSLWIYEGSSLQGTFILEGADAQDLQQRLLNLIAAAGGS
jgi:dienelactone hydrolase